MKKNHKIYIACGVVGFIMIISNPTKNEFTEYCSNRSSVDSYITISRENIGRENYLFFSIHEAKFNTSGGLDYNKTEKYFGVFGTFIDITHYK